VDVAGNLVVHLRPHQGRAVAATTVTSMSARARSVGATSSVRSSLATVPWVTTTTGRPEDRCCLQAGGRSRRPGRAGRAR
jgi:hypothetical protein